MFKLKVFTLVLSVILTTSASASETLDERIRSANLPSTTAEELVKYANDSDSSVRIAVATRQTTPGKLLIKLSKDPDFRVRAAVAHNLRSPEEALKPLVNDPSEDVRFSLAHCGYTPPDILKQLVDDPEPRVRKQLILNPNLEISVLREIAQSESDTAADAQKMLEKRESEN